jgi:AraC-like DNA-binding protein
MLSSPTGLEQALPAEVLRPAGTFMRTSDIDAASEAIKEAYAPNRLQVADGRARMDLRMWLNDLPGLNLGYVSFGTEVSVSAPPPSRYVVCLPTAGRLEVGSGRDSLVASPGTGAITSAFEPSFFNDWSPDCRLVTLRFDKAELENVLSSLLGRPLSRTVRFDLRMNLTTARAESFLRSVTMLRAELQRPDGMTSEPMMAASLARLVMTGLLLAQPHNYSQELQQPARSVMPGSIRNAIELIESGPAEVCSVADLAKAASLSVRALEEGFQKHVGMPPMTYLRQIRLERVHAELGMADSGTTTASSVARRWGFSHYGRFATAYRSKFGKAPAETLREDRRVRWT